MTNILNDLKRKISDYLNDSIQLDDLYVYANKKHTRIIKKGMLGASSLVEPRQKKSGKKGEVIRTRFFWYGIY